MDLRRKEIQDTKEKLKQEDYYTDVKRFFSTTAHFCLKCPVQWQNIIIDPILNSVRNIVVFTTQANNLYVKQGNKNYEINIRKRIEILENALLNFTEFEVNLELLKMLLDTDKDMYIQLKDVIHAHLTNLGTQFQKDKNGNYKYDHLELKDKDENEFSIKITEPSGILIQSGNSPEVWRPMKITNKNLETWITSETKAKDIILNRLNNDKKIIWRIENK